MHADVHQAAFESEAARFEYLEQFGLPCARCGAMHDGPGELCEECESAAVALAFRAALQQVEAERCWAVVAFALRVGPVAFVAVRRAS